MNNQVLGVLAPVDINCVDVGFRLDREWNSICGIKPTSLYLHQP